MPKWFTIKRSKHFTDGAKLVCHAKQSARYLSKHLLDIVDSMMKRNGFFAHPEHLQLAITQDSKKSMRVVTSMNSNDKADRCKKESSKNIHTIEIQI